MAVSKRLRFEVLRRDEHACQYCGESAPSVTLHVDHVVPVSLGGSDDPGNLVAACKDCNTGKSSTPADAPIVKHVSEHSAAFALALTDKMTRIRANLQRDNEFVDQFLDLWNAWVVRATGKPFKLPRDYKDSLRRWSGMSIPLELIEYAIDVSMNKDPLPGDPFRYMAGIVWRTLDAQETPGVLAYGDEAVYTASEAEEMASDRGSDGYDAGMIAGYRARKEEESVT